MVQKESWTMRVMAGVARKKRHCIIPIAAHAGERAAPAGLVDDEK